MQLLHTWETETNRYHAYATTRTDGHNAGNVGLHVGDEIDRVVENRQQFFQQAGLSLEDSVWADQVHGTTVQVVDSSDKGKGAFRYEEAIPKTDGLLTTEDALPLALVFADCVPLFFCAKDHGVIGIAHAGWKGTVGNIVKTMMQTFAEQGIEATDVDMLVGPSISGSDYEVDGRVLQAVRDVSPIAYERSVRNESGEHALLSLQTVNEVLAKEHDTEVMQSNLTTGADSPFFSYRDGETKRRFAAVIVKERKS
ncbi:MULTISPECIES: peptidoglycan editing factor PgeF [Exiguobacterium]|uniref:peptidoglycan editing factor PgeF n=1 Tax=Exiguobacterium TaxID=33986 RepID=UPI00093E835D|nr:MULTISPECIES: peptidoglycan editing factor PgeF [Exiguobacterium]MBG0916655.1 peptidoglycan editing factor PgeF [Exiguobacterium sp. SRB7LM]